MQEAVVISIFFKFFDDNQKILFGLGKIKSIFSFELNPRSEINLYIFFVFTASKDVKISSSINCNCFFFKVNAANIAKRLSFLFIFFETVRGFGPKITPPPTNNGDLKDPALAFPVPFCFHGFLPPPRTSALVFVDALYSRAFFN